MELRVQYWTVEAWTKHEFMDELYQDTWMDISIDRKIMEVWI